MLPNRIYHIYNRGINKETLFYSPRNYLFFRGKIEKYICSCSDLLGYCLMPNHFHLLVLTSEQSVAVRDTGGGMGIHGMSMLSWGIKQLLSSYAKAINKQQKRTGSLFCQNTPRKITDDPLDPDGYSAWCLNYIHLNPCRAGLAEYPEQWVFSSYQEYFGDHLSICNTTLTRKMLHFAANEMEHHTRKDLRKFNARWTEMVQ